MNPVDLIRELAEALNEWGHESGAEVSRQNAAIITRAQAFLAAQPVAVEIGARTVVHESPLDVPYLQGHRAHQDIFAPGLALPSQTPCTVHVIVVPSAREP